MQKYEIKGIVGEGAYGIVYQAKVKETGEIGKYSFLHSLQSASNQVSSLSIFLHRIPDRLSHCHRTTSLLGDRSSKLFGCVSNSYCEDESQPKTFRN